MPRESDVVLTDIGERVALKCTGSLTKSHVVPAQLDRRAETDHIQLFVLDAAGTDSRKMSS